MKIKLTHARVRKMKPAKNDRMVWDAKTPHFALRVRSNGTKRYMHIYTDPDTNKQRRTTIGDPQLISVENARSIAARLNDEAESNKKLKAERKPLFADYANDVWMPHRGKLIKPRSHARNRLALDKQLLPVFGNLRLDEITKPVILKWFNRYSRDYPGGANRTFEVLRAILNHAVEVEVIQKNPTYGITKNARRKMNRFLTDAERRRLLTMLGDTEGAMEAVCAEAVKLLLLTGCRAGEIANLRWCEMGEDRLNLEDSKTGPRTVWLSADAIELLAGIRERGSNSPFVFPHPDDAARSIGYVNLHSFWVKRRKSIGISDVRLHDLRHSFATQAIRQGVAVPVVSKLLGHKRIEMTMRYTHASNADAEAAAERIGKRIAGLLEGDGGK